VPIRIGLVNRTGDERLYIANCSSCAIGDGHAIPSPEPSLTPSYYSDGHFPAWFRLSRIELVNPNDFLREFGGIPSLNPTLYEVRGQLVIPGPSWNLNPIKAEGEAILHISDLHFGADHGYPLELAEARGLEIPPLVDVLADSI